MNDNFSNEFENQIMMTEEEKKQHKRIFSKICFAFLLYLLLPSVISIFAGTVLAFLAPQLLNSQDFLLLLTALIQYVICFPVLCLALRKIPKQEPKGEKLDLFKLLKYLFVTMFFMYIGNNISNFLLTYISGLLGRVPENSIDNLFDTTGIIVSALVVGLIGPIFEELIFRKLFIDRLVPYGETVAVFFSALIFGLFHGNLYQFFYAFFIGIAFSYIYVKTGKIIYTMALHIFVNMFCGVLPSLIFSMLDYNELLQLVAQNALTEEYILANLIPMLLFIIYSYGMVGMAAIGLIVLFRNIKNVRFNKGEIRFPKSEGGNVVFFNVGSIILIAASILLIAYNTFAA